MLARNPIYRPNYDTSDEAPAQIKPVRRLYLGRARELYCLVDEEDYEWARQWGWNTIKAKYCRHLYVRRNIGNTERRTIYLHRELMLHRIAPPQDEVFALTHVVDHINCQTFDMRRCNLRWATKSVNARNTRHSLLIPSLDKIEREANDNLSGPAPVSEYADIPF
jgi:hypothetical protein